MKRKIAGVAMIMAFATMSLHSQNVTLTANNKDAESVFADLMQQTGKNFIYPADLLKHLKVSVKAKDTPLTEVLSNIFKGSGITYKIKGNNVTLRRDKTTNISKYTISGFVKEAGNDEALVGATVIDLKSGKAAVTNANGFY